jgi:hypothetical protein
MDAGVQLPEARTRSDAVTYRTRKTGREQRKQTRYLVNRPGVLRNPEEGTIAVQVLDVSITGLRVSLPCKLPLHAQVEIEYEGALLSGEVRHCQCIGAAAFNVGISLLGCNPEDPASLNPHHLRVLRSGMELR